MKTMRVVIHIKAARYWIRAESIDAAIDQFCDWRDAEGYGVRNIGSRYAVSEALNASATDLRPLGTLSYNGSFVPCAS